MLYVALNPNPNLNHVILKVRCIILESMLVLSMTMKTAPPPDPVTNILSYFVRFRDVILIFQPWNQRSLANEKPE